VCCEAIFFKLKISLGPCRFKLGPWNSFLSSDLSVPAPERSPSVSLRYHICLLFMLLKSMNHNIPGWNLVKTIVNKSREKWLSHILWCVPCKPGDLTCAYHLESPKHCYKCPMLRTLKRLQTNMISVPAQSADFQLPSVCICYDEGINLKLMSLLKIVPCDNEFSQE